MKEQTEKKIKEIEVNFEKGRAQLAELDKKRVEVLDYLKRLQGAYALLQEQLKELTEKNDRLKKNETKKK